MRCSCGARCADPSGRSRPGGRNTRGNLSHERAWVSQSLRERERERDGETNVDDEHPNKKKERADNKTASAKTGRVLRGTNPNNFPTQETKEPHRKTNSDPEKTETKPNDTNNDSGGYVQNRVAGPMDSALLGNTLGDRGAGVEGPPPPRELPPVAQTPATCQTRSKCPKDVDPALSRSFMPEKTPVTTRTRQRHTPRLIIPGQTAQHPGQGP